MKKFAILIAIILALAACIIFWAQYELLFYPSRSIDWSPDEDGLHYREFYLSPDGTEHEIQPTSGPYICCWHINFGSDRTALFCHGNGGNISHRSYIVNVCKMFKLNLILFDYRGYGKSGSYSNLRTLHSDANSLAIYLKRHDITHDKLLLWGESLGGAVATYLASIVPCQKLILMATFSSLSDIVKYNDKHLLSKVIKYTSRTLPSKKLLPDINVPTIIMHSTEDELIPYRCAEKLYSSIEYHTHGSFNQLGLEQNDKRLVPLKGTHASPIFTIDNFRELMDFLEIPQFSVTDNQLMNSINEVQGVVRKYNLM